MIIQNFKQLYVFKNTCLILILASVHLFNLEMSSKIASNVAYVLTGSNLYLGNNNGKHFAAAPCTQKVQVPSTEKVLKDFFKIIPNTGTVGTFFTKYWYC